MRQWEQFLEEQTAVLGREAIDRWARSLKVVDFDALNLYLEAADSFQENWFEQHLRPLVIKQFKNSNGRPIKVHLASPTVTPKKRFWKPVLDLTPDRLHPDATFATFFPGHNQTPVELLQENSVKRSFNPLYLTGVEGCGKTHLLMAYAHALPHKNWVFVKADTFTHHLVTAIRSGEMDRFRHYYRSQEVVLIDDIETFANRTATQEELFHTFNALHLAGKQIVLAARVPPSQLTGIEPRLTSRFEWGMVLTLKPLNREERSAWLTLKAPTLTRDVHAYLIDKFDAMPTLKLALQQAGGKPLPLVEKAVAAVLAIQEKKSITPAHLIKKVADHFGVATSDILGKSQSQECALPRQIAMYLCRAQLKLPYTRIGEIFSRDHSTVMTSVKLIEKKIGEQDTVVLSLI